MIPIVPSPIEPGPLVYGHRGARAHAEENTVEAFRLAIEQGADGVELDAWLTQDAHIVVYHDDRHPSLGWITECSLRELRRADPSIPTLDEAFAAVPAPSYVDLELKNGHRGPAFDRSRHLAAAVMPIIDAHGMAERVLISSFDPLMVRKAHRLRPDVLTGLLLTPTDPRHAIQWAAAAGHATVNVHRSWLAEDGAQLVAEAAAAGLAVCVWTVNDPAEVVAAAEAGAAVLITDDPAMAVQALSAR